MSDIKKSGVAALIAARNNSSARRVCTRTVMDTSDPDIVFDSEGVCNWWHEFQENSAAFKEEDREGLLKTQIAAIKESGRNKTYNCLLGLSGGVDSSYLAYLAKKWELRPLIVHFDNGWNDERAVGNIEKIVKALGFQLHTVVMYWPEFRDLQRSFFRAGVVDLEVPTDHMIFGALHKIAAQYRIKYILSGNNYATEGILPRAWYYSKGDLVSIKGIHRAYGELPMKKLPKIGVWQRLYYHRIRLIESLELLQLVDYEKLKAKQILMDELDWRDYGGKHYESVFTRFYQGCILPERFGIDKRKAHLSNLICNGEISRSQALRELKLPTYDPDLQEADRRYVAKKLGWSEAEFKDVLRAPVHDHNEFGCDGGQAELADRLVRVISPVVRFRRKFQRR